MKEEGRNGGERNAEMGVVVAYEELRKRLKDAPPQMRAIFEAAIDFWVRFPESVREMAEKELAARGEKFEEPAIFSHLKARFDRSVFKAEEAR